ncbi:MAG TPA: glycosyltransferase [Micromonosporaceae bacterium]|jgi:1,2-diacylglycerol 3-beta-galactosyltransferase
MTDVLLAPTEPVVRTAQARLLVLFSDTGGGHRAAAQALIEALHTAHPGRYAIEMCDPLRGPGAHPLPRAWAALYGPAIRYAPWAWGALYHATNSRAAMRALRSTLLAPVATRIAAVTTACPPTAIVSVHPLLGPPAVEVRDRRSPGTPVVTIITDLVTVHSSWLAPVDRLIAAHTADLGGRWSRPAARIGTPVGAAFAGGPATAAERVRLRHARGLPPFGFVALLSGGGEGGGNIARRAATILRSTMDTTVVAICGRNTRLHRRLVRLARRYPGRLVVRGYVGDMAAWLRCADVLVTKAGPGAIAEALCCGTPLLLTGHVPGQERGNADVVIAAGAGRAARSGRALCRELSALREPAVAASMRAAAVGLGRPGAAAEIAGYLAEVVVGHES